MVAKGMEIIAPGTIVTQEAVEKLEALHAVLQAEDGRRSSMTSGLGQALFLLVISALFCLYLISMKSTQPLLMRHYWAFIVIHIVQIIALNLADQIGTVANQPSLFFPYGTDFIWIQPFLLAPVLCTILFHFRVGLISALYASVLMGMQSSYDLMTALAAFLTAWATIQFLHQIRYRSHFILSSLLGILTLNLVLFMSLLLRNRLGWQDFWPQALLGSLSILFCVSLSSLFLIHIFERFFGITTNLTLMELSDFNHPALKKLSERAPGSFHHSIMVGNLAEKAATRIGANPLLTRVIALYHDIGKSDRPAFFTENQKRGENPHDSMDPFASMQLIRDHVIDGIRLAKEYKLPDVVIVGIPEHHGDNLIHSFYRKAKLIFPDRKIEETDFRYPGPRPHSKETALVMLADGIEATSRSMEDPSADALTLLVQNVIQTRLQEDQLRESGLSINDLEEIEIGFLQSLEGMFHTRIKYPDGVFITNKVLS
jgi:putative nucleotidyltransferase with HDIG domain